MRFRPLVTLTLEHAFYAEGVATGVRFVPDAATARRLAARWYAWRGQGGRLTIAVDAADLPPADAAPFRFLVWPTDPDLPAASEAFLSDGPQMAVLSTDAGVREDDGRWRLHAGDCVNAADLADPEADAGPHPAVPGRRPLLEVRLAPPEGDTSPPEGDTPPPLETVVRLASRKVFWTYLVQGAADRGPLSVVDAAGELRFEAVDETPLPGRAPAQTFRSADPLALAERPPYRFQLREQGSVAERVLIRRLPGAGNRFRPIPGQPDGAMQAEIFVHV
ncbi:MAG: hypothetical protein KDC18_06470 [Alphaproteobacteria bacterium]|nr:hypothetical protein [Alphaproteobacteria bacterium]MCB9931159.1 hypothetical protein [Alphaproteobacteria bacterium]